MTAALTSTRAAEASLRLRTASIFDICLCVAFIAGYVGVGWTLALGPDRFHESNSMHIVAGLGISWPAWGVIYVAVALLLTNRRSRVAGYFFGAVLCGFYLTSYVVSTWHGNPGSAPGLFAGYAAVLSQVSGFVRSVIAAEWRHE